MLKAAIEKIEEMSSRRPIDRDGHTYTLNRDGCPVEVRPELDEPEEIQVNSLDALAHLIRNDSCDLPLFVSAMTATKVEAFCALEPEDRWIRKRLYRAVATDIPGWDPETILPFDEATVALMTRFQDSPDREYCIQLLSQISTGAKVTYTDNGIASTIVTQKGAALAENMRIKPLVKLRPYRTFQEVEQPEGIIPDPYQRAGDLLHRGRRRHVAPGGQEHRQGMAGGGTQGLRWRDGDAVRKSFDLTAAQGTRVHACGLCGRQWYESLLRVCPERGERQVCAYCCRLCAGSYRDGTLQGCRAADRERKGKRHGKAAGAGGGAAAPAGGSAPAGAGGSE